jgi:hypothetical protein
MNEHRRCSRTADIGALKDVCAAICATRNACGRIASLVGDHFAFQRFRTQYGEARTAEGKSAQNTTGLRRDKSACHAGRQVADATRLSSGKSVGRWQVSANSREITRVRIAHYVLTSAARLAEANR